VMQSSYAPRWISSSSLAMMKYACFVFWSRILSSFHGYLSIAIWLGVHFVLTISGTSDA
jgi:hypothetical protein